MFLDLVPVVMDAAPILAAADAVLPCWPTWMTTSAPGCRSTWVPTRSPRRSAAVGREHRRRRRDRGEVTATTVACARSRSTGPAFHNHGASASWELAGSVAAGVAYLSAWARPGVHGLQISFRFAADDDQFMTTAKVARANFGRGLPKLSGTDSGAATVHGVTSLPMMAERDPWVNMLRTTLAAFGAASVALTPCSSNLSTSRSPADSRDRDPLLAADRLQHPAVAAGGIPCRAGARSRGRVVVR